MVSQLMEGGLSKYETDPNTPFNNNVFQQVPLCEFTKLKTSHQSIKSLERELDYENPGDTSSTCNLLMPVVTERCECNKSLD